jgi:hypothetical protein
MDGRTRVDHQCVAGDSGDHLACFAQGHDYIGPDPVAWVERLREVNTYSHFPAQAKATIDHALERLQRDLQAISINRGQN